MLGSPHSIVVPDLVEPVVGWRGWDVVQSYGVWQLVSPGQKTLWAPGQAMLALCRHPQEARGRCNCGINAFASREQLLDDRTYGSRAAVGEVNLWGEVHRYTGGWRGQMASPRSVMLADDLEEIEQISADLARAWPDMAITTRHRTRRWDW